MPILKKFLKKNFPNLHIVVKACDDDKLSKIKEDQRKIKNKEGDHLVFGQGSDSGSISSSDEEELEERAREEGGVQTGPEKAFEAVRNPVGTVKGAVGKVGHHDETEDGVEQAGRGSDEKTLASGESGDNQDKEIK